MRKLLSILFSFIALSVLAQSQVTGNVQSSIALTLQNTNNPLGVSAFPLSLQPLLQATLQSGTGIGKANQLFAKQYLITNGALVGTNVLCLWNMSSNNTGNATSDPVGNAYALTDLKLLIIQNIGQVGTPLETNALFVTTPAGATAWTNWLGDPNFTTVIYGPSATPAAANTPTAIYWNPGDAAATVGAAAIDNCILFTNVTAGTVIAVNVYAVGSTGQ